VQNIEDGSQGRAEVLDGFALQRMSRFGLERAGPAVLLDALPRTVDGELLGVQQVLHQHDKLDLAALVYPVTGSILGRIEKPELAFPIAQHVGFEIGELANITDREKFLKRVRNGHRHCSALSSRSMRSRIAWRGAFPSNRIRETSLAI